MKAFPRPNTVHPDDLGMDLRDYFAAKAMQSLIIAYATIESNLKMHEIINGSYQYADAVMEARNEQVR